MSRADWKRSSGLFSRQWRTTLSRAGETHDAESCELRRLLLKDRVHRFDRRVAPEGPAPGQQLVEDRAEGEDVRAVVRGPPRTCSGDM